ncbi:MAG: hypothetical protein HZC01_04395 [Candidatus Kerfeldbacteria bacterium]|nr:hypothetical protein [Candidatus Kerfeldbacteria bacterium]
MFDIDTIWLKISYYSLSHKDDLRKWYVIVMLAVAVFFVVFSITNIVLYTIGIPRQQRLISEIAQSPVDFVTVRQQSTPQALQLSSTYAIAGSGGRYDVVAPVTNPNQDWFAEVTYSVTVGGIASDPYTDVVNPDSRSYLVALGASGPTGGGSSAQFSLVAVNWYRVDHREKLPTLDFAITDVAYSTLTDATVVSHQVQATVTNNSYTNFFEVPFIVLLFNGENIVGVNYAYVKQFMFDTSETITVKWSTVTGSVTGVQVETDLNLLNADNII